jgi:hypothetical protein
MLGSGHRPQGGAACALEQGTKCTEGKDEIEGLVLREGESCTGHAREEEAQACKAGMGDSWKLSFYVSPRRGVGHVYVCMCMYTPSTRVREGL